MRKTTSTAWFGLVTAAIAIGAAGCDDATDGTGGSGSTSTATSSSSATMTSTSGNGSTGASMSTGSSMAGCMAYFTGAITKSVPCTVSAGYKGADDLSALSITYGTDGAVALGVDGELTTLTYDSQGGSQQAGTVSAENGTQVWAFDNSQMMGSSTFLISSVTVTTTSGTDKTYEVHGSMAGVAKPQIGSTADVNISITF